MAPASGPGHSSVPAVDPGFDAVALIGTNGQLRYISPGVEALLGYSPAELRGRSGFDFVHPDDRLIAVGFLGAVSKSYDTPIRTTVRWIHRDGSVRSIECVGVNRWREPTIAAIVVHVRDRTPPDAR